MTETPETAPMSAPRERVTFERVTPDEVAAHPALRNAARVLASMYVHTHDLTAWFEGSDHTPHPEREFVADLIDADHVLDHHARWLSLLAGAEPRADDEDEAWLIARPWRTGPHYPTDTCCVDYRATP